MIRPNRDLFTPLEINLMFKQNALIFHPLFYYAQIKVGFFSGNPVCCIFVFKIQQQVKP